MPILQKTYSCGATVSYLEEDRGKSFTCHRCGHMHSYPEKVTHQPAVQKSRPAFDLTLRFYWDRFKRWLSRLLTDLFPDRVQRVNPGTNSYSGTPVQRPGTSLSKKDTHIPIATLSQEIKDLKNELIRRAWHQDQGPADLSLSPAAVYPPDWIQCLRAMLKQAELVAPKLTIPFLIPKLLFQDTSLHKVGGTFQLKSDGTILITIKKSLELQPRVALAVIAHELCHYILGNNNIRKETTLLNEKMTDVCMFVLGFGRIFLEGRQEMSGTAYGYLDPDQYRSLLLDVEAKWLIRDTFSYIDTELDELERWAIRVIGQGDRSRYEFAYDRMEKKHPGFTKKEILEKMKYDFLR